MGYTHYWSQTAIDAERWAEISDDIRAIVSHVTNVQGVTLWDGLGDKPSRPEFTPTRIAFNGAKADGHETFQVLATADSKFCETARKPYDIAVTACLCYLATVAKTHTVSSDGGGRDWLPGLELARQALPRYANQLDIPRSILEEDRWVGPYAAMRTERYAFRFCVDGHAYILGPKGRSYRFDDHQSAARWAVQFTEKPIRIRDWNGNTITEGGKSLFRAYGHFNDTRVKALARQQAAVLREKLDHAEIEGRAIKPPAFVRPGEMAVVAEPLAWSLDDLAKLAERSA